MGFFMLIPEHQQDPPSEWLRASLRHPAPPVSWIPHRIFRRGKIDWSHAERRSGADWHLARPLDPLETPWVFQKISGSFFSVPVSNINESWRQENEKHKGPVIIWIICHITMYNYVNAYMSIKSYNHRALYLSIYNMQSEAIMFFW